VDQQHVAGHGRERAERPHAAVHPRVELRGDVGAAPAPRREAAPEGERLVGHRVERPGPRQHLVDVHRARFSSSSTRSASWPAKTARWMLTRVWWGRTWPGYWRRSR